jgi:hypothetical protein
MTDKSICPTCKRAYKRSNPQNNISHAWYLQLAEQLPEDDALGWKCFCKLHFGIPILRAEDAEFKVIYDKTLRHLEYSQKLQVMKVLPVTSLMTADQLSKYLDAMQSEFLGRGVRLEFP